MKKFLRPARKVRRWLKHSFLGYGVRKRRRARLQGWVNSVRDFVPWFSARGPIRRDWDYAPAGAPTTVDADAIIIALYFPQFTERPWNKDVHAEERKLAGRHGVKVFCYCIQELI